LNLLFLHDSAVPLIPSAMALLKRFAEYDNK
jgi:hypothetical protein